MKLFDTSHIKSSFSKLLLSMILKEKSKFKHYSLSKSSSSSGSGVYSLTQVGLINNLKF